MGLDRLVLKYADPEIEEARKSILAVMRQSRDSRARLRAAGLIMEHERVLHMHETPEADKTLNVNVTIQDKHKVAEPEKKN